MTHERALAILVENAGIQFDPEIVATFIMLPREVLAGASNHSCCQETETLEEVAIG